MATWLHCNSCFYQPGDGKKDMFLTSCGHMFCQKCQDEGWKIKCLWCGKPAPGARKLNEVNNPSVDVYLSDPAEMIKQLITVLNKLISTELNKILMTMEFQRPHAKRYLSHLQQVAGNQKQYLEKQKYELQERVKAYYGKQLNTFQEQNRMMDKEMFKLKEDMSKLAYENAKIREDNTKLKDENSYLKRLTAKMSQGGPSPRLSPSGDRNFLPSPNSRSDRPSGSPVGSVVGMLLHHQTPRTTGFNIPLSKSSNPPSALSAVRQGRISVRTPPSGGRMGIIPGTPSPQMMNMKLPRSAPSTYDYHMETPPRN